MLRHSKKRLQKVGTLFSCFGYLTILSHSIHMLSLQIDALKTLDLELRVIISFQNFNWDIFDDFPTLCLFEVSSIIFSEMLKGSHFSSGKTDIDHVQLTHLIFVCFTPSFTHFSFETTEMLLTWLHCTHRLFMVSIKPNERNPVNPLKCFSTCSKYDRC